MKSKVKYVLVALLLVTVIVILSQVRLFHQIVSTEKENDESPQNVVSAVMLINHSTTKNSADIKMSICMVCCGDERIEETQTSMKSAILFSKSLIKFYIFTEPKFFSNFSEMVSGLPLTMVNRVELVLRDVKYPENVLEGEWRALFRPCASLRLFLPNLLLDVDAVVYLDTDVLFLSPVLELWSYFHQMNSSQLAGVTPEHQNSKAGWYNKFAKHPYYGKLGINSGVMLMNLTRMRQFNWSSKVTPLKDEYQHSIRWGDQDILNILFHFNPELVLQLDCSYNYRPDHCIYGSACSEAETSGVKLVHANRRAAHMDKYPPFRETYQAMFRTDSVHSLYRTLREAFTLPSDDQCGAVGDLFIKNMRQAQ